MIEILLLILVILWLTGNLHVSGWVIPRMVLFSINGQAISLIDLLIFFVILWAIGILPSPIREIAGVLFVLWLLSVLGFLAIAGLSSILVIAIIVGIVISIVGK